MLCIYIYIYIEFIYLCLSLSLYIYIYTYLLVATINPPRPGAYELPVRLKVCTNKQQQQQHKKSANLPGPDAPDRELQLDAPGAELHR